MHALLFSAASVFNLKEELFKFSFFNWVENLSSVIFSRVLKDISNSISLGAIAFNVQVKIVRSSPIP